MTGHTPTILPVLNKYYIIKLGIKDFKNEEQIAYQFSHELCHFVFYSIGEKNDNSDSVEENLCEAMTLIIINKLYPKNIDKWEKYINNLDDPNYNKGGIIAHKINYDIEKIKILIYKKCKKEMPKV